MANRKICANRSSTMILLLMIVLFYSCHPYKSGKFSYISKFHILISYKLTIYIVMCFYQETN